MFARCSIHSNSKLRIFYSNIKITFIIYRRSLIGILVTFSQFYKTALHGMYYILNEHITMLPEPKTILADLHEMTRLRKLLICVFLIAMLSGLLYVWWRDTWCWQGEQFLKVYFWLLGWNYGVLYYNNMHMYIDVNEIVGPGIAYMLLLDVVG